MSNFILIDLNTCYMSGTLPFEYAMPAVEFISEF